MPQTGKFVRRACCAAGQDRGRGYVAASDGEVVGFGHSGQPGPLVGDVKYEEVSERTAFHEAAHAVVGHGLGSTIMSVSVAPPVCVRFAPRPDLNAFAGIVEALAGGAGEDARAGWRCREPDTGVRDFIARALEFEGGGCDECSAAYGAWACVGPRDDRSEAAAAVWRAGEDTAAALLALPNVRAAVAELADTLMSSHRIAGDAAHAIISKNVGAGSLAGHVERTAKCWKK